MHNNKYIYILLSFFLVCFIGNAKKNVTLRINNAYAPFEYLNNDGKPVGFTVDIFNAINNLNHFNYTIKSNKEIFNFYSTVIDSSELVTSMDSVPHDCKFVASQPYGYIDNDIVTRIFSEINTWEDMEGKNILIIKDSPLIHQFKKQNIKPNFIFIKSVPDGLRLLSSGKYDAMISSNDAAYFYISRLGLSNLTVKPLFCQPLSIRFVMLDSPENRKIINQINLSLQAIRSNGTYDTIFSKRFYPDADDSLKLFELSLIIIGSILMMVFIVYILYIHWLYQAEKRKKIMPVIDDTPFITNLGKIYDSIPTVSIFFDDIGRIKFINQAGHNLVNSSRKTKLHLGQYTLFNHTILNDEMIDNLKADKVVNFTYNLICKESIFNHLGDFVLPTNKIYNIFIMPVSNYGTILNGYLAYIYDITALHNSEYQNLKYISSLSQIADNKLLDIYYYDNDDNVYYAFSDNTAKSIGLTYEEGLLYIHPLNRSYFNEEFLSIMNGEKKSAELTVSKRNDITSSEYNTCHISFNAIRVDNNTTIGISIVSTTVNTKQHAEPDCYDLQRRLSLLSHSNEYHFFEYDSNKDEFYISTLDDTQKHIDYKQMLDNVHPGDRAKVVDIINDLKTGKTETDYIVIRYLKDEKYNYYRIRVKIYIDESSSSFKIIGFYHNITEYVQRIQELEEFSESTILTCEANGMGYFEYCPTDSEHIYIPYIFTEKYGFDDDNFIECMDDDSRNTFNRLIEKFNAKEENIGNNIIKLKSPKNNEWIYLEFLLQPIKDDLNQEIYKYMGFLNDITDKYSNR